MFLICLAALGAMLPLAIIRYVYQDRNGLPDVDAFVRFEPPSTGAVYDADGELLFELAHEYREVVSFEEIPDIVRAAVLAAEDKNFFSHRGIDYGVLPRVVFRNLQSVVAAFEREGIFGAARNVSFVQGGSTLTQQLVRGYFLADLTRPENTDTLLSRSPLARIAACLIGVRATNKLVRKAEEIRLTLWLEDTLQKRVGSRQKAKEMIFARYASFIYLGNGRYGLAAASKYYFDKPIQTYTDADADEAALLAAIIKSPRTYAPTGPNIDRALRRRNAMLALMVKNGSLDTQQAHQSQREPIEVMSRSESDPETTAPALVAHVFQELRQNIGGFGVDDLVQGRIHVQTTMNDRVQHIADEAVEHGLDSYERRHPKLAGRAQTALVVLQNADGSILAEVGGRRFYNGNAHRYTDFNRAIQSLRQPGSALKPLVYLAAFRHGYTLDTYVLDEPIDVPMTSTFEVKAIANYDSTFKGPVTVRQALAESRNAATVWTAREIGMSSILQTAREVGIHTPLQPYLSTALGASEVTLVDLANVYRALASGRKAVPHVVQALTDRNGDVVYAAPDLGRLVDIPQLPLIQEALRGVVRLPGGTARALNGRSFPIEVMGKTGTSSNFRDALFVGSTYGLHGITVAVWMGHDDGTPLGNEETGGKAALPIFREVMTRIYQEGLVGTAPEFPSSIEHGIDTYIAEASTIQTRDEQPMRDVAEPWTTTLRAEALAIAAKFASFVSPRRPSPVRGSAPPVPLRNEQARRGWKCTRGTSGMACVAEGSAMPSRFSGSWARSDP